MTISSFRDCSILCYFVNVYAFAALSCLRQRGARGGAERNDCFPGTFTRQARIRRVLSLTPPNERPLGRVRERHEATTWAVAQNSGRGLESDMGPSGTCGRDRNGLPHIRPWETGTPMRNDQIAVMLRDFANRCLQWALVLEKEDEIPFPDVPVQLPGPDNASIPRTESPPNPGSGTFFQCPMCQLRKPWKLAVPPWPNAVCSDCFRAVQGQRRRGGPTP